MSKYKSIFISFILFGLIACTSQKSELIELNFENDLIPEGIAIDAKAKKIYLNSLKSNKIVSSELDGKNPTTFLESEEFGYLSGFGMTTKGDTLYALGNSLPKENNKSVVLLLQLSTGNLIDSYVINDDSFHYLNDLAISSKNEIFITDSESNKIYRIQRPFKKIEVYLDTKEVAHSNGITISNHDEHLYLASSIGIRIVDIETKEILNDPNETYSGIDGLKFHNNNLYGIVNVYANDSARNGLFKYKLNPEGTTIISRKKVVEFEKSFNIPTTFDIANGNIYFVTNTQLDNYDGDTNQILDLGKLKPYRLMKTGVE